MSRKERAAWNRRLAIIAERVAIGERERYMEEERRRAEWEIPEPRAAEAGGIHAERAALIDRFFEKQLFEAIRRDRRI